MYCAKSLIDAGKKNRSAVVTLSTGHLMSGLAVHFALHLRRIDLKNIRHSREQPERALVFVQKLPGRDGAASIPRAIYVLTRNISYFVPNRKIS